MNKKQRKILIRIIIAISLAVLLYLLDLEGYYQLLFIIPYFVVAYDVFLGSLKSIKNGHVFDEKFLMIVATIGAFFLKQYSEAVAVMAFYQVGELFESISLGKSRKSIKELMNIKPVQATVLRNNKEVVISPEKISINDQVVVKPGEKIPIDGTIVKGITNIDSQALTGESLPENKVVGDRVLSGSINLDGLVILNADNTYQESTVAKILELVEQSTDNKAKIENFITRFAKYYTPTVVFLALIVAFIFPLILDQSLSKWLYRGLMFLVVSCPCALVISVPLSFFGGIGLAAKQGILIKGSNYMQVLAEVKKVVFDKTGTLTKGDFAITAIHPKKYAKDDLLRIAAYSEVYSLHPIAKTIIKAYKHSIDKNKIEDIKEIPGKGIVSIIAGSKYFIGNEQLMKEVNIAYHDCHLTGTIIHISTSDEYLGHIVINDKLKTTSYETIKELKNIGVKEIAMLSGDKATITNQVAKDLKINKVYSELLPQDKVRIVESMIGDEKMAFVGDGINDAPVIARSDVGIAMGALGSDAAIEAADVVLMNDNPLDLVKAIKIAKKTLTIAKENVAFSLVVKIIILMLAALGIANMWLAVFGDVGVTVIAIFNAMRCLRTRLK